MIRNAHVPSILEGSRATEDVVLNTPEKRLCLLSLLLESIGCIKILDMLLESRAVGPGFKGAVVTRFNSLDFEEVILGLSPAPWLGNLPGTYW